MTLGTGGGARWRGGGIRRPRPFWALATFLLVAAPQGRADAPGAQPVLHENVDVGPPRSDDESPTPPAAAPAHGGASVRPTDATPSPPAAGERDVEERPDRDTDPDGALAYTEVFDPAVVPFKRMSAFDAVGEDYSLGVRDDAPVEVPVGGAGSPDRDTFRASLVVDLSPGRTAALPSVAPDMRILAYDAWPEAKLAFFRDSADNYSVRAEGNVRARVRLSLTLDAPASYFSGTVPHGYLARDAARGGLLVPLPASARRSADEVLRRIGVAPELPLEDALGRLVTYFRSFEAGPPPEGTGDVYRDLALLQRGTCRHRTFAFVVTANSAGIPARYVANEAHAFAEAWVPETGWIRLDLGGAALDLTVTGTAGRAAYQPRHDDPFPRPPAYERGYTRAAMPPEPSPLSAAAHAGGTRIRTAIVLSSLDSGVFRGDPLAVAGQVTAAGRGAPGLRVNVYLSPAGLGLDAAVRLGEATTGEDGAFAVAVEVPGELALGLHEVFAATPGDARYAPSASL